MLTNNSFTDTIPPLFNLSNLEVLQMSYNIIQGNIPKDIENLSRLQHLDLKFNNLTGSIPVYSIFRLWKHLISPPTAFHAQYQITYVITFMFSQILIEYGSEGKVSTSCDVYSYGIMLLEMFTRTKPTDDMFQGEMNLQNWVTEAIQENQVARVVAPGLQMSSVSFQTSVFGLALECLAIAPEKSINMIESVVVLKNIKTTFLARTKKQHAVALNH